MPKKKSTMGTEFGRRGEKFLGKRVTTPDGPGKVEGIAIFSDSIDVRLDDAAGVSGVSAGGRKSYKEADLEVVRVVDRQDAFDDYSGPDPDGVVR